MPWNKEVEMVWISGWSQIVAFYQRNSWSRLWVARRENWFNTGQNHPEYPFQEKGQSGGNESSKRRPLPPRKTDRLPDLRVLPGHWSQWFCRELGRPIYSCSSKWWYSGIRFEMGRNFCYQWRKSCLLKSWKDCTNWEYESLRNSRPNWNCTIWRFIRRKLDLIITDWRQCGRSIEQNLRMMNFEARNGNFETSAVVKSQKAKQRGQKTLGDCWQWKVDGPFSKGDNCSFCHDINKRAKSTQTNLSQSSFMQQDERKTSRTRSPRGRSQSWKMALLPFKDYLTWTCTTPFCEKWHPPEYLFYKSENECRFGEKCSYAHRQVDEQPSKKLQKNGDKSAYIEDFTTIGCVFQDMESPKSTSILRKSSNTLKPIRCVQFTNAMLRHANIRDQNPSLGMICPGDPQQRNPNAPKFESRSQEET